MIFIKNHEVLTTEREPEGPAQRSNFRNEGIFLFASFAVVMIFIKNHEVLTTEREPEGPAQRSNFRNEGIFLFA